LESSLSRQGIELGKIHSVKTRKKRELYSIRLSKKFRMAHGTISVPKGPSAIDILGLKCAAMTREEISGLASMFARKAALANKLGFGGVEIHAAHGFLLSQFLSPLFNRRGDAYGGSIENRMRVVLEILEEVRFVVGRSYPIGVKLNSTDNLEGGVTAWYTMKLIEIVEPHEKTATLDIDTALEIYLKRDAESVNVWNTHFSSATTIRGTL
jgi:2,4-dienoyl-CoA reductase-like NADH-dependent reductase (Old Yellow Enzyme family)